MEGGREKGLICKVVGQDIARLLKRKANYSCDDTMLWGGGKTKKKNGKEDKHVVVLCPFFTRHFIITSDEQNRK